MLINFVNVVLIYHMCYKREDYNDRMHIQIPCLCVSYKSTNTGYWIWSKYACSDGHHYIVNVKKYIHTHSGVNRVWAVGG